MGQAPSAAILGCSDSRVPPELVFDQGLGDLFVLRVAGNVATPSQVGSIEFAAGRLGTRLVVVLGHTRCGAVQATVQGLEDGEAGGSPALRSIVERVQASVEPLWETELRHDPDGLLAQAIRANVLASVDRLRRGSKLLSSLIRDEGLLVVGAEYDLGSGLVDFFDGA